MDRIKPEGKVSVLVKRGFHNSRLVDECSASAYEIIIPEIISVRLSLGNGQDNQMVDLTRLAKLKSRGA